jgi:putative transposase
MQGIDELVPRLGVRAACRALGVPRSTYYRFQQPAAPPRIRWPRRPHPRALSSDEQAAVRDQLNSERFVDRAPRAIYATLLDEGVQLCHWSTMYRLLRADAASSERRAIRRHVVYTRPELLATAPRQVWSWDITKLRGPQAGSWYNLYVVLDIFSRMIVGWLVAEREDASLAEVLIADACTREAIEPQQLTVHADRGAPMTSKLVAELLLDLGVTRSHSRPSVSNDNPYSEAQFKTMKYGPSYPERFGSIEEAQAWVSSFIRWYNTEHRHSALGLLPPVVVHHGQAAAVSTARQQTLDAAYARHPERFVGGRPVPPLVPAAVWINPPRPQQQTLVAALATEAAVPADEPGSRVSAAAAAP